MMNKGFVVLDHFEACFLLRNYEKGFVFIPYDESNDNVQTSG